MYGDEEELYHLAIGTSKLLLFFESLLFAFVKFAYEEIAS